MYHVYPSSLPQSYTHPRYLGGSGIREHYQSTEGALWIIDSLIDLDCKLDCYAGDIASRAAIAQGHSIAAHAYHKKALIPLDELTALLSRCNAIATSFAQPALYAFNPHSDEHDGDAHIGAAFHISLAWSFEVPTPEIRQLTDQVFSRPEIQRSIRVSGLMSTRYISKCEIR